MEELKGMDGVTGFGTILGYTAYPIKSGPYSSALIFEAKRGILR